MKKLYSLVAFALVAGAASAQTLYFKGAGEGLSWDEGVDLPVEQAGGVYTVEIKSLTQFKFSTVSTTEGWDAFNGGALFGANSGTEREENLGKPIVLENNDANNGTPWKGDYTIVVAGDLSTITLTTTTPKPTEAKEIFLRGSMNDWGAPELWRMNTNDGVFYWFNCQGETKIPGGTELKIADAEWGAMNFGAGDEIVPFDEPIQWYYNANNGMLLDDYEGTVTFDLSEYTLDNKVAMVTFFPEILEDPTGAVSGIVAEANAPVEYFNLQGVRVANPENGLFIRRQGSSVSKVLVK